HEGVVNFAGCDDGAHGNCTIGDLLGNVHDVGRDTEELRAGGGSHAAECRDHFVEDQQNVVLRADFAQTLQIALGRHDDAGRPRHGFDDYGGNIRCVVQLDELEQFVGQLHAARFRLATAEGLVGLQGVGQVIDVHERAEHLAVAADAAQAGAGHVHAVVGAG